MMENKIDDSVGSVGNSWEKSNLFCVLCGKQDVWYKRWNNTWSSPTPDCKYASAVCLLCVSCGRSIQVANNEETVKKESVISALRLPKIIIKKNLKTEFERHLKSIHKNKEEVTYAVFYLQHTNVAQKNFLVPEIKIKESFLFDGTNAYQDFLNKISKVEYNENDVYCMDGRIYYIGNSSRTIIRPWGNKVGWRYEIDKSSIDGWRVGEGGGVRGGDHSSIR